MGAGVPVDPEWAANVESCFSTRSLPQPGQSTSVDSPRINFSNRVPQSWQRYSKMGMASMVALEKRHEYFINNCPDLGRRTNIAVHEDREDVPASVRRKQISR